MPSPRYCKECQKTLLPDWPEVLCPQCLVKHAEQKRIDEENEQRWSERAPTVDEIANLFPQLEVNKLIGQGGMGWVYKARQPGLDRLVSLKILSPKLSHDRTFAERFIREAKAMARLSHPNIVAVYDFGISGGCFYFVMEFVDGLDLQHLAQKQRPTPADTLRMISQICDALQYAHDEGVIHRDIKPGNILIDKKGRVKIADFGLAKLLGTRRNLTLTQSNQAMGTLHYMAPEQTEKPSEVDHRADIYSMGVVFYELLTGELPLGRFAPPSQKAAIDERLDDVVLRALEKEPQRRYQQAGEIKYRIEAIIHTPVVTASVAPPPSPPPEPIIIERKPKIPVWVVPAISVVCVLLLWWNFERRLKKFEHAQIKQTEETATVSTPQASAPAEQPASAPAPTRPTPATAVEAKAASSSPSPKPIDPEAAIIFAEDFESGLTGWKTILNYAATGDSTPLQISLARNRKPGGARSAQVTQATDKMEYTFSQRVTAPVKAAFWIYTSGETRAYGELIDASTDSTRMVVSVGRHFPPASETKWEETAQPDSFHARLITATRSKWFNLDAPDSPEFSEGWHKFEIELLPNEQTVTFRIDGVLGKQITQVPNLAFNTVRIGSVGVAGDNFPAWFDDVKISRADLPQTDSPEEEAPPPAVTEPEVVESTENKDPLVVFSDDFESGDLKKWNAGAPENELHISPEKNHTPNGSFSAAIRKTSNKMYKVLDPEIMGPAKATIWIHVGTHDRIYGQIRSGAGQIYSIGRYHLSFDRGKGDLQNETMSENHFQGRLAYGANSGFFNLDAPGAPGFSDGWHKFEIERLADGVTVNYYVDGILGRQVKDSREHPWSQVEIGSAAFGDSPGTGWFDDVRIEKVEPK